MSAYHRNDWPTDADIDSVLAARAQKKDYPLTAEDVRDHGALLHEMIRAKITTLAGFDDETPMTIVEALNHVLMSMRWILRNKQQ